VAAALTATRFVQGHGCAVGDATEGLIALPVATAALRTHYNRRLAV
jgi:hypothetical protein